MVHSGFVLPRNETAFKGMGEGWPKVVQRIDALTAEREEGQGSALDPLGP
jgi:hypothetical protein